VLLKNVIYLAFVVDGLLTFFSYSYFGLGIVYLFSLFMDIVIYIGLFALVASLTYLLGAKLKVYSLLLSVSIMYLIQVIWYAQLNVNPIGETFIELHSSLKNFSQSLLPYMVGIMAGVICHRKLIFNTFE